MKLKILLSGANGLLGQKIVDLVQNTYTASIDLLATSKGASRLDNKTVTYRELDITNEADVLKLVNEFRPDVIINTAAMTNVDACEAQQEACQQLNVNAVQFLGHAAKQVNAHFIQLSTDFIFDGASGPYDESAAANPLSIYGRSKWNAEQWIEQNLTDWCIIRTIIIYGVTKDMSRSNVVLWAKGALEKQQKINVVDDQFRSPTLAEDLAAACIEVALRKAKGVYHVSGAEIFSILELVQRVAHFFNLDSSFINSISTSSLNQAAARPPRTGFIIDKAKRDLDYRPHTFEEGLAIVKEQLEA